MLGLDCAVVNSDLMVEKLWNKMEDVPFSEGIDGEMYLDEDWENFSKGTSRTDIWHWFDENHSKGVYYLLYEMKR